MALTIVMMMMFDNNTAGTAENLTYRDASRIQGLEGERGGGEGEEREGKGGVREGEGRGGGYRLALFHRIHISAFFGSLRNTMEFITVARSSLSDIERGVPRGGLMTHPCAIDTSSADDTPVFGPCDGALTASDAGAGMAAGDCCPLPPNDLEVA